MCSRGKRYFNASSGSDDDQRRSKHLRSSYEKPLEEVVNDLALSSSLPTFKKDLEAAVERIAKDYPANKARIRRIIRKCVIRAPYHLTVYSTLVGVLNSSIPAFGTEFVEHLIKVLCDYVKYLNWIDVEILVILICDLVNSRCVSADSCFSFLESFFHASQDENISQIGRDYYVYLILLAIPWVAGAFVEEIKVEFEDFFGKIDRYMKCRSSLDYVSIISVWNTDEMPPQKEYLESLWSQILSLKKEGWKISYFDRYQDDFVSILRTATPHKLPSFTPCVFKNPSKYPSPKVVFRIYGKENFLDKDVNLPDCESIERFLLEQDLIWIIEKNYQQKKECAHLLVSFRKREEVSLDFLIVEVLFGKIFQLPKPRCAQIFYSSLLIELCHFWPNTIPQVVAQATQMICDNLDTMNTTCFDRFVDWLSFHLCHFKFLWSWENWINCVELNPLAPQRMFFTELLCNCLQLSYHERLVEVVPTALHKLIPEVPLPKNKFSGSGADRLPGASIAQHLTQALKEKCTPEDVHAILMDCPYPDDDMDMPFNPLKIEVLTTAVLVSGSRSISHTVAILIKYMSVFKEFASDSKEAQLHILQTLHEVWFANEQRIMIVVDKMLKMQIIQSLAVIDWIFSEKMRSSLMRQYVWQIVFSMSTRLARNIKKIQEDLEKKQTEEGTMSSASSDDERNSEISAIQMKLSAAQELQKAVIFTLLQKMIILLSEHLLQSDAEDRDSHISWFKAIQGRMIQIFNIEHKSIINYADELSSYLFTSDIDAVITEPFYNYLTMLK
ncbi:Nuclear cap-binding protein subunit 1 [Trichinella pseudospiralis]|uniref:Nuclear cap-binding protein subunit 1 n=3 Tax=Trichinella pseudospiralis TaxID=6337 RepID=A0A0V1ESV4_TRIPS|nr:Nuclear cap-binding protein subunit 1 [Trichinella pseudospiralis]KRY84935.1 Nuclear cap-binding protein subunit 1 [Trichinella pseudospiralis]KRZ32304.1 Nuclear cap-binding protein subunit 1 [Trichinella pseudospiralis]KRZ45268.1 Nuclear cap-binding protein subunit 1 [Trichinella pseudospiralis]